MGSVMYPVKETSISHFCFMTVSLEQHLGVEKPNRTQFQEQERVEIFQLLGSAQRSTRGDVFLVTSSDQQKVHLLPLLLTLSYINTMP